VARTLRYGIDDAVFEAVTQPANESEGERDFRLAESLSLSVAFAVHQPRSTLQTQTDFRGERSFFNTQRMLQQYVLSAYFR
jgi:hypothetical protein